MLRGCLLWVTVLGVWCFVAVCCDPTLQVCVASWPDCCDPLIKIFVVSWLAVIFPCFRRVVLRGWLLRSMLQVCGASWLAVVPVLQVCGASWLAVALPASGVWCFMAGCCARAPGVGGSSRPLAAYCIRAHRQGHEPTHQRGGANT